MAESSSGSDPDNERDRAAQEAAQERAKAAGYIAEMSASLAELAKRHELRALGYLLDMVHIEAETQARANGPANREN